MTASSFGNLLLHQQRASAINITKVLNVTEYFNPIDCRSLGIIRTTLATMEKGEILEVHGNRFQHREIAAWTHKFKHPIVKVEDIDGLVKIYIEKGGLR